MNSNTPNSPPEDFEARITALLLGELNATEAAEVRQAIASDQTLALLEARLRDTIALVREATRTASNQSSPTPAKRRLSNARREKLLRKFKALVPELPNRASPRGIPWYVPMSLAAAFILFIGLAGLMLPSLAKAKSRGQTVADARSASMRSRFLFAERMGEPSAGMPERRIEELIAGPMGAPAAGVSLRQALSRTADTEEAAPVPSDKAHAGGQIYLPGQASAENGRPETDLGSGVMRAGEVAAESAKYDTLGTASVGAKDDRMLMRYGLLPKDTTSKGDQLAGGEFARRVGGVASKPAPPPTSAAPTHGIAELRGDLKQVEEVQTRSKVAGRPAMMDMGSLAQRGFFVGGAGGMGGFGGGKLDQAAGRAQVRSEPSGVTGVDGRTDLSAVVGDSSIALPPTAAPAATEAAGYSLDTVAPQSGAAGAYTYGFASAGTGGAPTSRALVTNRARGARAPELGDAPTLGNLFVGQPQVPAVAQNGGTEWAAFGRQAIPSGDRMVERYAAAAESGATRKLSRVEGAEVKTKPSIQTTEGVAQFATELAKVPALQLPSSSADKAKGAVETQLFFQDQQVAEDSSEGRARAGKAIEPTELGLKEVDADSASHNKPVQVAQSVESAKAAGVAFFDAEDVPAATVPQPPPEPQPEVQSNEETLSTFSLNISDVSFRLAAASLEKGALPPPASVRSEEFINAFDYRDSEPAPGLPLAFAWERAQYSFAHNRELIRFAIRTAARGRDSIRPLNLVLLLDSSGSMERADRVSIIREALSVLARQLRPEDTVSVVAFARTARLWVDALPGSRAAELVERVGNLTPEGGTNLEDALNLAYATAARHFISHGVNRVVLLTDGAANLGDVSPASLEQKVIAQRQRGIALDCFGIGWEGYNDDLLEVLSRHGDGRYGFVNTIDEATTDFADQLAGALQLAAADVKVQVEFNPRRVIAWRQIGYAKHKLTVEQFRDNTVDAAEVAAAESGNALYLLQTDHGGDGAIGVVRVRYREPATGLYRETQWPVPYTGSAPPLDQAAPSLRLAGVASAFSEWLVSSPYAGEVTPDRLLNLLRGVPDAYDLDPRPRKLEQMLAQAKAIAGK